MGGSEQLQWIYSLVDKYSSTADRLTKSTDAFDSAITRATKHLADFEAAGGKAQRTGNSFAGWAGPWGIAAGALKTIGGFAFDLALGLGEAAFEAGRFMVSTLAFKENTLVSFELMLGSAEKAKELYKTASDFARVTPFETKDVVTGFQKLISAGFNESQTKVLFQALGDVAAAAGDKGGEAFERMVYALGQIRALGHVTQQDLHQLTNWSASMGIGVDTIYDKLSKLLGKTKAEVQALQGSGQLKSDALIYAFTQAIQEKAGGKVGGLIERQSSTITGLLSTLKSAPFDFINTLDPTKSKGLQAFKGFLENLVGLFDTGSSAGGRFAALIDKVFNETFTNLFEDLSGPEGQKRLAAFFENAVSTAGKLYDVVAKFLKLLDRLAPSLQTIDNLLTNMTALLSGKAGDTLLWIFTGKHKGQGFEEMVKNGTAIPWDGKTIPALPPPTDQKLQDLLDSSKLQSVESATAQSKALADSITNGPLFSSIGESVMAPARGSGGGAGTVVHLTVQVDARGVTDPSGVAEAIREQLPAHLEHLFSRLAIESGRAS